jgi:hypothetical protein
MINPETQETLGTRHKTKTKGKKKKVKKGNDSNNIKYNVTDCTITGPIPLLVDYQSYRTSSSQ